MYALMGLCCCMEETHLLDRGAVCEAELHCRPEQMQRSSALQVQLQRRKQGRQVLSTAVKQSPTEPIGSVTTETSIEYQVFFGERVVMPA